MSDPITEAWLRTIGHDDIADAMSEGSEIYFAPPRFRMGAQTEPERQRMDRWLRGEYGHFYVGEPSPPGTD